MNSYDNPRRLRVADLVFFVVAASAPLTVVAGGLPTVYGVTGVVGALLLYLAVGAALAVFTVGYARMSRHVSSAGAFYAYIGTLGPRVGAGAALVALVAYNAMQIGLYGLFGVVAGGLLDVHWMIPAYGALLVIAVLGALRVDLNARTLAVMLVIETALVLLLDFAGLTSFDPTALQPSAVSGEVGLALCFVVSSFMGFESASVYASETRDPSRAVARATYIAVAITSVFYAFSAWTMTVAAGPSQVVAKARELGPALAFELGAERLGGWIIPVGTAFLVTSVFAALLSFHNVVARYFLALGRDGVLPRYLARTTASGAPVTGSLTQTALAGLVILAFYGQDPLLTLFTWLTNLGALGIIALLAATSVSVVCYFGRLELQWTSVISAVVLSAAFVLAALNFDTVLGL